MPPKRPRNLRKTKPSSADWDEPADQQSPTRTDHSTPEAINNNNNDAETSIDPADLLEYQKLRSKRHHGIDPTTLAKGERKKKPKKPTSSTSTSLEENVDNNNDDDNVDADNDKGKRQVSRSLDGAFTQQNNKLDANKHMMAYIEDEMRRHKSGADGNNGEVKKEDQRNGGGGQSIDDLYQVPEHLRVVEERPVSEGNVAMASKMLTSIQEVDLGAESKSRNVVATNQALTRTSHRKDDAPGLREGSRYRRLNNNNNNNVSDRSARATDEAMLQRFKKRMRR